MTGCGIPLQKSLSNETVIVGHRGASGYAPEDTMESFRLAKEKDVDNLEFDVQMSKDGFLVAIHDADVIRITNGQGEVKDITIEEIKNLAAGKWFNEENPDLYKEKDIGAKVPIVREIFEEFGTDANY